MGGGFLGSILRFLVEIQSGNMRFWHELGTVHPNENGVFACTKNNLSGVGRAEVNNIRISRVFLRQGWI